MRTKHIKKGMVLKVLLEYWRLQNNPVYIEFYKKFKDTPLLMSQSEKLNPDQYRKRVGGIEVDDTKRNEFYEGMKRFGLGSILVDPFCEIDWDHPHQEMLKYEALTDRGDSGRYPVKAILKPESIRHLEIVNHNDLIIAIDSGFPKKEILEAISVLLKKTKGRSFTDNFPLYAKVWNLRKGDKRLTFRDIARRMDSTIQTTKMRFYKAFEMVYGVKYDKDLFEGVRSKVHREALKKECASCKERATCKDLCPDVMGYIMQDWKKQNYREVQSKINY